MKRRLKEMFLTLPLLTVHGFAWAGDTVEVHGILEQTSVGMILVTDASSYMVRASTPPALAAAEPSSWGTRLR